MMDWLDQLRSIGLFVNDIESGQVFPNHYWYQWGYTDADMANFGYLDLVHPDDRANAERVLNELQKGQGESYPTTFRFRTKAGEWRWVHSISISVTRDPQGNLLKYVGFDFDITAEREAKELAEKQARELGALQNANAIINSKLSSGEIITAILEQAATLVRFDKASIVEGNPAVDQPGSVLRVALVFQGRPQGTMILERSKADPFTADEERLAGMFSLHVAIALENARPYREAHLESSRDGLTGSHTRRAMDKILAQSIRLAHHHREDLSVILLDIDDFKAFNDTFGHVTGDAVLQAVASAAQSQLRESDTLCRYGGEEFLVILPLTASEEALSVAERIRGAVATSGTGSLIPRQVTVSGGCATLAADELPVSLIDRADQALLRAKREGKNQIVPAAAS